MQRLALTVITLLAATPAFAAKELWSCALTERCNEYGCEAADSRFTVQLNTDSGSALMTYADQGEFQSEFPARVIVQGDARHVVFDNSSGIEVTTMTEGGAAIMSGHMTSADTAGLIYYRLNGTCSHDR